MQTDLRLSAKVEDQNGEWLGEIKHLVMGQDKQQVTHIVVGGEPYEGHLKTVEMSKIGQSSADKGSVRLNLSKAQFEQLPDFDEQKFNKERDYPTDLDTAMGGVHAPGQGSESFAVGGYSYDQTANPNPPGLVDNQSRKS